MKRKNISSIILSLILINLIIGSSFLVNSQNIFNSNLKLSQSPNVELISEAGITTRWDFVNETAGFNTLYYEPFDNTSNYWDLTGVSERTIFTNNILTDDAYVDQDVPNNNYGNFIEFYVDYLFAGANEWSYIKYVYPYLDLNITSNSSLYIFVDDDNSECYVYNTTDFSESTITWNNKPALESYQNYLLMSAGYGLYDIGYPSYYYVLVSKDGYPDFDAIICSSEGASKPYIRHHLFKNFQGSGILYMQTNVSETLTLRSPDNLDYNLQARDKIEVQFNTSSANQINFNLRNDGSQQKSYILSSQGNGNFETRVQTFTIDANMTTDQLEFIGSFIDTKNLIIDYVKILRPYSETDSYYLAPYERRELVIDYPYNYTVEIYEHDVLKDTKYITTSAILQTLIYERVDDNIVYMNYFDSNNEHLDFNNYITYVNYTLEDFTYTNKRLSSNILYVDVNTQIYLKIYDSFNALVKNYNTYEETFIDITLNVYSLKIKNEYQDPVFYELKNVGTEIIKSGNIFSEEIIGFSLASGTYQFNYTKNGVENSVDIDFSGHQILVINSSKMCFLTYTNQKGEHLFFDNYKTYIDGSLIYENIFYSDVGVNVSIEIKDHFDISIKNESYVVQAENNYIPVILIEYSLKVMNLQQNFNHINITRDPNYYSSSYYWSEWIAPGELIRFNLFPGYYKINLTDNENEAYSYYAYTLSGDDILLISSNNTISQVIYSLTNINTTIGNQITAVYIDLTNQNSNINNSIIIIDINLGNINSTLGNMLINLDVDIDNIANNISSLYMFTNTSFINLNSNMNTSFIYLENNIISINQSISQLIIGVDNTLCLINGTITTMITDLGNNLLLMNTSINTSLFLINNSINLLDSNLNNTRIAILNNLILINNSISDLIAQVYSSVYLINNSIYNAVIDLGTSLTLINNTISGNLSIILQQNDFLTELYKTTMFSELLNWTGAGYDTSFIENQIDAWEIINKYRDQAIEVHLKYQDKIEKLTVSAQNTIEQNLPKEDVEYRLWSETEQKYLNKWEELPANKTISFGFFEENVPVIPKPVTINTMAIILTILGVAVFFAVIFIVYIKIRFGRYY